MPSKIISQVLSRAIETNLQYLQPGLSENFSHFPRLNTKFYPGNGSRKFISSGINSHTNSQDWLAVPPLSFEVSTIFFIFITPLSATQLMTETLAGISIASLAETNLSKGMV